MLQIYFGNGKGKTTAAVGAAIRMAGSGERAAFTQFFKDGLSGECSILKNIEKIDFFIPNDEYRLFEKTEREVFLMRKSSFEELLFGKIEKDISRYKMLVLDEGLDAFIHGYFDVEKFLVFLKKYKTGLEIILTGHSITEDIISVADYVSEVKEIKHPFKSGVPARKGIEF